MAEVALDAVRRELREFPAAVRGEWVQSGGDVLTLTAEQPQDVGGAGGKPRTGAGVTCPVVLPGPLTRGRILVLILKEREPRVRGEVILPPPVTLLSKPLVHARG